MRSSVPRVTATVLAIAAIILAGLLYRKSAECREHASRIETLYSQALSWQRAAMDGQHQADSLRTQLRLLMASPIVSSDIRDLQRKGLRNPVDDLIADLQRHPEVIPYPGTGNGMHFYDTKRIRILSDRWVYAPFEDGHNGGEAILAYKMGSSGKITWRLLTSRML